MSQSTSTSGKLHRNRVFFREYRPSLLLFSKEESCAPAEEFIPVQFPSRPQLRVLPGHYIN